MIQVWQHFAQDYTVTVSYFSDFQRYNATVFNFKYINSDISYQAYFSYVSVWGYQVSFR